MKLQKKIVFLGIHLSLVLGAMSMQAMQSSSLQTSSSKISWLPDGLKEKIDSNNYVEITEDSIISDKNSAEVGPILQQLLPYKGINVEPTLDIHQTIWLYQKQAAFLDEGKTKKYTRLFTHRLSPCIGLAVHSKKQKRDGTCYNRVGLLHVDTETHLNGVAEFIVFNFKSDEPINVHLVTRANSKHFLDTYQAKFNYSTQQEFVNHVKKKILDIAQEQKQKINIFSVMTGNTDNANNFLKTLGISTTGQVFLAKIENDEQRTQEEQQVHEANCKDPIGQKGVKKIKDAKSAYQKIYNRTSKSVAEKYDDTTGASTSTTTYIDSIEIIDANGIDNDPSTLEHIYPDPREREKSRHSKYWKVYLDKLH